MSEPPRILLEHRLKTLKLPTFLREYEKVARQSAQEGLDHVRFLSRLVELELIDRERRLVERRIKAAKFPTTKSLDSFEFKAIPSVNKVQVLELARCEWIERRENVIALGPSGRRSAKTSHAEWVQRTRETRREGNVQVRSRTSRSQIRRGATTAALTRTDGREYRRISLPILPSVAKC